jgi:transcription initiation factor TFIIE subunit alpha
LCSLPQRFDIVKWLELNGPQGTTTLATSEDGSIVNGPAIKINLAGDDDEAREKEKRERDAEAKRQQNQLPDWIAKSTITGEAANAVSSGRKEGDAPPTDTKPTAGDKQALEDDGSPHKDSADDLDAYYASLAAEAPPAPPQLSLNPASVALPLSATASPAVSTVGSPRSTPMAMRGSLSGDDSIATPAAEELEATIRMAANSQANANGKRIRDEQDVEVIDSPANGLDANKKARLGHDGAEEDSVAPSEHVANSVVAEGEGDDEEDDDFEEVEDGDDNPMIPIGDKLVPFLEVNEEMQAAMVSAIYWRTCLTPLSGVALTCCRHC